MFPDASLRVELKDGGSTQVDTNTVSLKLDAIPATPLNTSKSGAITTLTFTPAALFLPGSAHSVTLVFSDTAAPPKSFTNTWEMRKMPDWQIEEYVCEDNNQDLDLIKPFLDKK